MFKAIFYILFILLLATTIIATNLYASDVEISGFADFYYGVREADNYDGDFEFGQAELGFATEINEKVSVEAATTYDPVEELFGMGRFIVDFLLQEKENRNTGLAIGKFDVPFGIEWHVYHTLDRKFVTGPLAAELTHEYWNDYGIQVYSETDWYNGVLYLSNGFSYEAGYDTSGKFLGYNGFGYDPKKSAGSVKESESKNGIGGRIGLTPIDKIEVGGSFAIIQNNDHETDQSLYGIDLQANLGDLAVKGEYVSHTIGSAEDNTVTNTGMYLQGVYTYGRFLTGLRYGMFEPDFEGVDSINRISLLYGLVITEGAEIRLEYQANSEKEDDVAFLQLAVGF